MKTIFYMELNKKQKKLIDQKLISFPVQFKMDQKGNVYGRFDNDREWTFLWEGIPF